MKSLLIFGAGGHAKVVADAVQRASHYRISGFYDDNATRRGDIHYARVPIRGDWNTFMQDLNADPSAHGFIAIGNNDVRTRLSQKILAQGHTLATIIDPTAILSSTVQIGHGSLVVAGAVINADTLIGPYCIVNTAASIDHDCVVHAGAHIAPQATLCGNVRVGEHSFIGASATLIPNTKFPANSVLGAGSTLIETAHDAGTWVGSPAQRISLAQPISDEQL